MKIASGVTMLALALAFTGTASATVDIKTAEFYVLDGWTGEYPSGFQILEDLTVYSVVSPLDPTLDKECTLKKDSVIHPWAVKTQSQFQTLSSVRRLQALRDYEIEVFEGTNIPVKAGQEVIELSYLGEGYCRIAINGVEADDSCFGGPQDDRLQLVRSSPFVDAQYFNTACKEGYSAWINATSLSEGLGWETPPVKYAEIVDYGTVKEP